MPLLRHYDSDGTARFVTFNCYRNEPSLSDDRAKKILSRYIEQTRQKYQFLLLAYVIMPEHVHLVIHPIVKTPIGRVIGEIKSLTARTWFERYASSVKQGVRVFSQKRCYDHNCRTINAVREKIAYCHTNPVRRGLVPDCRD